MSGQKNPVAGNTPILLWVCLIRVQSRGLRQLLLTCEASLFEEIITGAERENDRSDPKHTQCVRACRIKEDDTPYNCDDRNHYHDLDMDHLFVDVCRHCCQELDTNQDQGKYPNMPRSSLFSRRSGVWTKRLRYTM